MEDMASLWSYQEGVEELKKQLLYTSLELQTVRAQADEEVKKSEENFKQLIQLLDIACQERDEARHQLQKLKMVIVSPTSTLTATPNPTTPITTPALTPTPPNPTDFFTTTVQPQQLPRATTSPILKPTPKSNSSITDSNSLSNYTHSRSISSPVDSFFDGVSSPELSNLNVNVVDSSIVPFLNPQPLVQMDYNNNGTVAKIDQSCLLIDNLAKGKTLPQKGYFLQAVQEAGPLLQSLLVAGPLPRWRNPPPIQTSFPIPPVSIEGCDPAAVAAAEIIAPTYKLLAANSGYLNPRPLNSQPYVEMSCASSQILTTPTSVLNFANGGGSGSFAGNGLLISTGANSSGYMHMGKRQRFQ